MVGVILVVKGFLANNYFLESFAFRFRHGIKFDTIN